MFRDKLTVIVLSILITIPTSSLASSARGCVELDDLTFNKFVKKFSVSLVKFDIAFPYGEKHEEFIKLGKELSTNAEDLLIGLVGVKDYGEKDNTDLAKKYNADDKNFPQIRLFKGLNDWVDYPGGSAITVANLKRFVQENSEIYIGLDGCVEQFDDVAKEFIEKYKEDKSLAKEVYEKLEEIKVTEGKEIESKKIYGKIMTKVIETDEKFLANERKRVKKLLKNKLSDEKFAELNRRLNIIHAFEVPLKNLKKDKSEL